MVALGFHKGGSESSAAAARSAKSTPRGNASSKAISAIAEDGTVTLEEFSALMTGELSGRDPMETVQSVFWALSTAQYQGGAASEGHITHDTLKAACAKYEVRARAPRDPRSERSTLSW
jgi:hypothetical protein